MPQPPSGRGRDGGPRSGRGGSGQSGVNAKSGGQAEGNQGLWEQAGKGEVDSISAALAPGGDGNVHACQVDGKQELCGRGKLGPGEGRAEGGGGRDKSD